MEYTSKKKESIPSKQSETSEASKTAGNIPNSALESVMAGRMKATSEMMGHRQDLAPSLNAKMSKAFGMDLNGVQVYRSDVMSGTGTEGLASGNKIVLSSDVDLNTLSGQAVLGHELSHIHAQSQGIGLGNTGLYENAGLEHQADTEGMMAARGLSLNGETLGMDTASGMQGFANATPMSSGMGLTAGAPMQAKKAYDDQSSHNIRREKNGGWRNKGLQTKWYNHLGIYNTAATRRAYAEEHSKSDSKKGYVSVTEPFENLLYKNAQSGKTTAKGIGRGIWGGIKSGFRRLKGYGLVPQKWSIYRAGKGKNEMLNQEIGGYGSAYMDDDKDTDIDEDEILDYLNEKS